MSVTPTDFDDLLIAYDDLEDEYERSNDQEESIRIKGERSLLGAALLDHLVTRFDNRIAHALDDEAEAANTIERLMVTYGPYTVDIAIRSEYWLAVDWQENYEDPKKYLVLISKSCHYQTLFPEYRDEIMQIAYFRIVMHNEYKDPSITFEDVIPILSYAMREEIPFGALMQTVRQCSSFKQWKKTMKGYEELYDQ